MDWKEVTIRNLRDGRTFTIWSDEVRYYPTDKWEVIDDVKADPAPKKPKPKKEADRGDPIDRIPLGEIKELKMRDLMEYAKGFGIKTFGRKKVDVLQEIEDTESYLKKSQREEQ